MKDLKYDERMH